MEKRAFLAVALSLLVLVLYQAWITHQYGTAPLPPPVAEKREVAKTKTERPRTSPSVTPEIKPVEIPSEEEVNVKDVRVETDKYTAVFTNRGGRLKSFQFKRYRSSVDENSPPFDIVSTVPGVSLPLGVQWQTPNPVDDSGLVYSVQGGDLNLTGDAKGTLRFQGRTENGSLVTKAFTFTGSDYGISLAFSVQTAEGKSLTPQIELTEKSDHSSPNPDATFEGLIALVDNKIQREMPDKAGPGHEFTGDISWAGFGYTYFLFALVPENSLQNRLSLRHSGNSLIAVLSGPAGESGESRRYTLYIGPKDLDTLKAAGKGLERSIDFGYFAFIAIPLVYALHFFHRFTGSYGIDIILLTIVIKILLAPLTHKSMVSMKKMQRLQPQMERLKERFKDDKEKLNKEIMELYRRNSVNPLGGCLPMLLQFPVFIGLYNALGTPIELRHAPFLWIKDLSRPDWQSLPFTFAGWHLGIPVLTILMGASMFVQQWMTPTAGDPNQRRMMLLMPLMFTFMFVTFPAGLTTYWLVNNVLSIGQQYWINRKES
jgi:YidC/Oxa1 family membrane protein insertase